MTSRLVMSSAVAAIITMQAFPAELPQIKGATVAIAFSFAAPHSAEELQGMQTELSSLLSSANVELRWFERNRFHGIYVDGRILVVNILGNCGLPPIGELPDGEPLAWNDVTDGKFQPFVTVDCTRVARFVAREIRGADQQSTDRLLGRAIGRVVAHEMYHFFTRTKRHSRSSSIFRAALRPHDLVVEGLAFEPQEIEKLEQGIESPDDFNN